MSKDKKEEDIDFRYEGTPPKRDLLDYRHMFITMDKWANTDTGWKSLLALGFFVVCFILGASMVLNALFYK